MIIGRWFGVALLLFTWQFISSALGQEKPKIFLGASSKTLGYSPLWVASKKGFFDKQGLDVQLVLLRGAGCLKGKTQRLNSCRRR